MLQIMPTPTRRYGFAGFQQVQAAIPYIVAGTSAAATAVVASWLNENWDIGTYNAITAKINDTIKLWDPQGWTPIDCWGKNPQMRKEFLAFWARWSKHYGQYGKQSVYLSDSAEMPVRNIFLPELAGWAQRLNKVCGIENTGPIDPVPPPPDSGTDWGAVAKWGAIGLGAIVLLNVVTGIRSAFPRQ